MTDTKPLEGVVCHYCHNPRHVRQNCGKLQNKNRRFQSVRYQKSLKSASTSIITLAESGKIYTCFLSSSSTWVIDSGVTDHMTNNSSLFTMFQSHRHLLETAQTLLFEMHVPKHFWANVVSTACFLNKRMSSSGLNWATPYH